MGAEIIHSLFTNGKNNGILTCNTGLNQLQNIAVIAAGQTSVTGNDDIGMMSAVYQVRLI